MCYTHRHDFGLDKLDDEYFTSGVTYKERMLIRDKMSQLYDNDVSKVIHVLIDTIESSGIDYHENISKLL